jgi:hypothetical protein
MGHCLGECLYVLAARHIMLAARHIMLAHTCCRVSLGACLYVFAHFQDRNEGIDSRPWRLLLGLQSDCMVKCMVDILITCMEDKLSD